MERVYHLCLETVVEDVEFVDAESVLICSVEVREGGRNYTYRY